MSSLNVSPFVPVHNPDTVDAILMASGFSKRFGKTNKLVQPFCGKPLAQHTLSLVCAMPQIGRVFFVCAEEKVAKLADPYPATVLYNQNPSRGACESIRLGVSASYADYYLFLPCDQPLLDEATLLAILARRRPGKIVVPFYETTPGSPSLFSAHFREELLQLKDGQNARELKSRHPGDILSIQLDSPLPLADVDTPQRLAELEALALGNCGSSCHFT